MDTIGVLRTSANIGLMKLVYSMPRLIQFEWMGVALLDGTKMAAPTANWPQPNTQWPRRIFRGSLYFLALRDLSLGRHCQIGKEMR